MQKRLAESAIETRRAARRSRGKVVELVKVREHEDGTLEVREVCKRRERMARRAQLATGRVPPMYAIVTRTFREYGGPQEGGWYYDRQVVEEVRRAWTYRELLRVVRALLDEHPTDRYGRSSVVGNSGDVTVYLARSEYLIESLEWPAERPVYE